MACAPHNLPLPRLDARRMGARRVSVLTDEALLSAIGVRIAFTSKEGGVSEGPYTSLNLGSHVGDDLDAVMRNRRLLMEALGAAGLPVLVPNQVHGSTVVNVDDSSAGSLVECQQRAQAGSDALVVATDNVAALLCFADCTPVIIVSPSGRFAVCHAGWRGVVAGVAPAALEQLVAFDDVDSREAASRCNVYIGPHIAGECFEVGPEVVQTFACAFGDSCVVDSRHISMAQALRVSLCRSGVAAERIVDAGMCTVCHADTYYSYRASGGTCGRHGAIAFRKS